MKDYLQVHSFLSQYDEQVFHNSLKLHEVLFANLPAIIEQVDISAKCGETCIPAMHCLKGLQLLKVSGRRNQKQSKLHLQAAHEGSYCQRVNHLRFQYTYQLNLQQIRHHEFPLAQYIQINRQPVSQYFVP
jgi:hypothetical protein